MELPNGGLAALLRLQQGVRDAETMAAAGFVIVNETRDLVPYVQATLLQGRGKGPLAVSRLSNLSEVDRTAPYVTWVEALARHVTQGQPSGEGDAPRRIEPTALTPALRRDWADLAPPQLLWVPLVAAWRGRQGALVLARDEPWQDHEIAWISHLAGSYALALHGFAPRLSLAWRQPRLRRSLWIGGAALVALMFLPVRLSVLAPAEVSPLAPFVVTAPLDGVVSQVVVQPNQLVRRGALLAEMEATDLRGARDVSRRSLEVAEAELRRTQQAAFTDPSSRGDLARLQAQVDLRRNEMDFATSRHGNTRLESARDGVAIIDDPLAWKGRPVRVGERIMSIADPAAVEITVMVPVRDAIVLLPGHEVRLFLDTAPLTPLPAVVSHATYEPMPDAAGAPAYKVTARLDSAVKPPRIGLRGTAKLYGEQATLFYYLLRKPITALRQWLGW